jgi:hypothetical protein
MVLATPNLALTDDRQWAASLIVGATNQLSGMARYAVRNEIAGILGSRVATYTDDIEIDISGSIGRSESAQLRRGATLHTLWGLVKTLAIRIAGGTCTCAHAINAARGIVAANIIASVSARRRRAATWLPVCSRKGIVAPGEAHI